MEDCPECGTESVIAKGEGKICNKCGLIVEEQSFMSGRTLLI
jgi:transcription initiation factor TFIIIB Brf1 subunit/transcription initiation factor TFIIB